MKVNYFNLSSSLGAKVIIAFLFIITLSAFYNPYPDIPQELRLKEYYYKRDIMPEWMIYDQRVRSLPKAPYKNLKRKTTTFYVKGSKKYLDICNYNRNGIQINKVNYINDKKTNSHESESYSFDDNGLLNKYFVRCYDGLKGFYYHYKFDKYNRLIKVWTDTDERGTKIEYLNNYECVEYPNRGDNLTKKVKWNKDGIILYCDEDNHYGERYIYKYDENSRIALAMRFSQYDTTSIDSAFYNQDLNLLCYKTFYKEQ